MNRKTAQIRIEGQVYAFTSLSAEQRIVMGMPEELRNVMDPGFWMSFVSGTNSRLQTTNAKITKIIHMRLALLVVIGSLVVASFVSWGNGGASPEEGFGELSTGTLLFLLPIPASFLGHMWLARKLKSATNESVEALSEHCRSLEETHPGWSFAVTTESNTRRMNTVIPHLVYSIEVSWEEVQPTVAVVVEAMALPTMVVDATPATNVGVVVQATVVGHETPDTKFCPNCGASHCGAKFCSNCGQSLT